MKRTYAVTVEVEVTAESEECFESAKASFLEDNMPSVSVMQLSTKAADNYVIKTLSTQKVELMAYVAEPAAVPAKRRRRSR